MMYLHYCKTCNRLHMLNGHRISCPGCESTMTELNLSYLKYVEMSEQERQTLLDKLHNAHNA